MNRKNTLEILLASSIMHTGEYNINYIDDEEVNECLMNMYFYLMLINSNNEKKKEEYFQIFENSFQNLNSEQQGLVREEYINIIEAQSKNKEKIKKKGMINYE